MDVHLNLEKYLTKYFDGTSAIIYPDYMGCNASIITAFAKRGDLLLVYVTCLYDIDHLQIYTKFKSIIVMKGVII